MEEYRFSLGFKPYPGRAFSKLASAEGDLEPSAAHGFQIKRKNGCFATVARIQPMF